MFTSGALRGSPAWLAGIQAPSSWGGCPCHLEPFPHSPPPLPRTLLPEVFWKWKGPGNGSRDLAFPPYLGLAKDDLSWRGRLGAGSSGNDNPSSICLGQTLWGLLGTPLLAVQSHPPLLPPAVPDCPSVGTPPPIHPISPLRWTAAPDQPPPLLSGSHHHSKRLVQQSELLLKSQVRGCLLSGHNAQKDISFHWE